MRFFSVCLIALMVSTAACAESSAWMSEKQVTNAFSGVTINGVYADGRDFTESYRADQTLSYKDQRGTLSGRWSAADGLFCTLYDSFITGGCFHVTRHSGNCYEFYFVASSEREAVSGEPRRESWTAQGWDSAKPATCDQKPSS